MKLSYSDLHETNILFLIKLRKSLPCPTLRCKHRFYMIFLNIPQTLKEMTYPLPWRDDSREGLRGNKAIAVWPASGAVQPMEASFQECLGTGRRLCSETETTRKVIGEQLWSVEKQVRTESKDIASEAGKRKSTGWRSMGWQLSSISSLSRAAYKAGFPGFSG